VWGQLAAVLVCLGLIASDAVAQAAQGTVSAADWKAYREKFVTNGRVIDDANGGITHSESQGYGLLLAFSAGDRASFEAIWTFTRTELLIRDDGLAAWRWDPEASPRISDINNATDGDILIAYALGLGGKAWNEPRYTRAGARIAAAIGERVLAKAGGQTMLLPGAAGFAGRDGVTVVNPSYWVFEAFGTLNELAPQYAWSEVFRGGRWLLDGARFGQSRLPSDWVGIGAGGKLAPASGFPPLFGYNGLRIPLYLLRAGLTDSQLLGFFRKLWVDTYGGLPAVVEVESGKIMETLTDPGYRMLAASLACALDGVPIETNLKLFRPTQYYPSTLHLLALALVSEKYPRCL
jgi:endo-1,4-beta-D-glucanase Y